MRWVLHWVVMRLAAGSLRLWVMLGLLLRVTRLRDRFQPLAVVFYTTPWPTMAGAFLVLAAHAWRLQRWHALRRYLLFTGGALFFWISTSARHTPEPPPSRGTLRVVHWNVARPTGRLAHIAPWLRAQDADLITLAEALPVPALAVWQREFPGYTLVPLPCEMLCLVRGEVLSVETGELAPRSEFGLLRVRIHSAEFTVLQADIFGPPLGSRAEALRQLTVLAEQHRAEPLLIAGDFNTPRESAHFDALRLHYRHVFETVGRGVAETWPMPLPALSLDHFWTSPSLRPLHCHIGWSLWSDHRPVVAELVVEAPPRAALPMPSKVQPSTLSTLTLL